MIDLRRYQREDGNVPVRDWLKSLRDIRARAQIEIRLRRLSVGHFGDCKPVGEGVLELRIDVGAGYRLYCARHGQHRVQPFTPPLDFPKFDGAGWGPRTLLTS